MTQVLLLWIAGLGIAADDAAIDLAKYDLRIKDADRAHWAYQPIAKPAIPKVRNAGWVKNPIDAFIFAELEKSNWAPAPPAEPRALLRRLYLDFTGLPPTPQEMDLFLQGKQTWAQAIDALLSRSTYGERWARHWLDVARYAETNGYERDAARPSVWRYRDYVIRAFNNDKPFDRFLLEQIAGDELPDSDADSLIATGFLRLGPWDDEPADPLEDRFDQLDDLVSTTSLAFLGLTMGCARCHDHKFEAFTLHDYYRLVAVFHPLQRPRKGRTELDLPLGTKTEIQHEAERDRWNALLARAQVLGSGPLGDLGMRSLTAILPDLPRGYRMHEPAGVVSKTNLLIRGKASRPGPEVAPGLPAVLTDKQPTQPEPTSSGSGRRLALAKWMASPSNPLTARVIVNRIWHYHFGDGLVRTPNDFGVMGSPPTHPELLDWLASWFIDNGWSIKKLHRLIATSNTYQMNKAWREDYGAKDPENQKLWRFPRKRLEAEAIRDSILFVSGELDLTMYGPSVYPEVPKDALLGSSDPDKIWKPFDPKTANRRTIYAHVKRSFVVPLLEVLDLCDTTRSSEKRLTTTVAPQALSLFNGEFMTRQSAALANRLRNEGGDDTAAQIDRAYRLALCRPATPEETRLAVAFAQSHSLEQFCRVLFNLNEFVYAD